MKATKNTTQAIAHKGQYFTSKENKSGKISIRKNKVAELENSKLLKMLLKVEREQYKESILSPLAVFTQTKNNLENGLIENKAEYQAFKIAENTGLLQQAKQQFYASMREASKEKSALDKKISQADLRFFAVNAIALQLKNAQQTSEFKQWLEQESAESAQQLKIAKLMASPAYFNASKEEKLKMLMSLA